MLGQNTDDAMKHVTEVLYQNAKSSKRKALTRDMNWVDGKYYWKIMMTGIFGRQ